MNMQKTFLKTFLFFLLINIFACKKDKLSVQELPSDFLAQAEKLSIPNAVQLPQNGSYTKLASFVGDGLATYTAYHDNEANKYYWKKPDLLTLNLYNKNNEKIGIYSKKFGAELWSLTNGKDSLVGIYNETSSIGDAVGYFWSTLHLKDSTIATGIFDSVNYIQTVIDKSSIPIGDPTPEQETQHKTISLPYKEVFFFYKQN